MFKKILNSKIKNNKSELDSIESSEFSRFFREASDKEREDVFLKIARLANEDQRKILNNL